MRNKRELAALLLRTGIAFVFIYSGVSSFLNPNSWIGFIPDIFSVILSKNILLNIHSAFNIFLGLWVFSGWKVFYSALVSSIAMFAITIFNLGSMEIVFRDVGLFFASLALVFLNWSDR